MLTEVTAEYGNVRVDAFHGLLVDYCRSQRNPGDPQGAQGGQRLRLRAEDGPDEPRADRRGHAVHADQPGVQLPGLQPGQGDRHLRRGRGQPAARLGAQAAARPAGRARRAADPGATRDDRLHAGPGRRGAHRAGRAGRDRAPMPMSASCVLPRERTLDLLDALREVLPPEMGRPAGWSPSASSCSARPSSGPLSLGEPSGDPPSCSAGRSGDGSWTARPPSGRAAGPSPPSRPSSWSRPPGSRPTSSSGGAGRAGPAGLGGRRAAGGAAEAARTSREAETTPPAPAAGGAGRGDHPRRGGPGRRHRPSQAEQYAERLSADAGTMPAGPWPSWSRPCSDCSARPRTALPR